MAPLRHLLALAVAAGSTAALTVPHQPRGATEGKPGFVSTPLIRRETRQTPRNKFKRDSDVPLYNVSSVSYLIELQIGTPGQSVLVAIDTGSDELWVNPDCSTSGSSELAQECKTYGQYDPNSSSTSDVTNVQNYIPYGKGEVQLQYVMDNITLTNSTLSISQQVFGVALASNDLNQGILGLSYGNGTNLDYNNLVDSLFLQGETNARAFSIALGSKDYNNGGTLIFGGVDTKKFTGDLVSRPILGPQGNEQLQRYWVELDGVAYNQSSKHTSFNMDATAVVLDSGSTLSYLPSAVVSAMAQALSAQYDKTNELYIVDCSKAKQTDSMDFTFGNATIRVPMTEFIWEAATNVCVLGAIPIATGDIPLLGDSMMRAGYFVFDQDNAQIHMAQYANCGEKEQAIPQNGNVSGMSGECTESDTQLNSGSNSRSTNAAGAVTGNINLLFGVAAIAAAVLL